jgi:nitroimidazol reductase NimA-like FMN-containing flavoprotein (pyridoxamine 5'-phosphate oxidase superfamily)
MPSRRETIAMTAEELRAYLARQRRIILVTNGPDGFPHPMPMNYGTDPEGRIIIATFRKSQKVRNLERDPRATLLVQSGETYAELKSAILYCQTEIISDPDAIAANMAMISADSAMRSSMSAGMKEQVRASLAKRVVLRFTLQRVISWDHGKLGGVY